MKLSFGKRLTASYLFVVAVTLILTGFFLTSRLRQAFLSQLEQSLSSQAMLIAQSLAPHLQPTAPDHNLQQEAARYGHQMGYRVTIIRSDGVVVGDSERTPAEVLQMDNHSHRPEVLAALKSGVGESIRHSATLDENMLYIAVPVPEGSGILRVALPLVVVHQHLKEFQMNLVKAGALAFFVAFLVALFSVQRISQPLRELVTLSNRIGSEESAVLPSSLDSRDEFGLLAKAFNQMAKRVDEKVNELTRERTQLGAMLSTLVESIVALDQEGRVLFLNPAAEELFSVRSAEVKNRPFLEVLRHSPLTDVLTQTLAERRSIHKEIVLHSPDERTLSVNALTVNYGVDQLGVLAALHDVTELRKLESIRKEFVANVSHELKTPLTSIKGFVETLLEGAVDDPKHNRAFLETIQEHTNNLSRLIDDVLDLSTIEAQRVTYRFEPVALQDIVERIIKALDPTAKAKKVSIRTTWAENLPKIRADREKVAQIVMNLIDNAIKFNKANGLVWISAKSDGKELHFHIQDTGRGIDAEDLPRVFERFYRGNKDRSHEIPGTGLGLAIVKHLIESHQGTVTAHNNDGGGCTFKLTFPLA